MSFQSSSVFHGHIKAVVMTSSMLRLEITFLFFKHQPMIMPKATVIPTGYGLPVCCSPVFNSGGSVTLDEARVNHASLVNMPVPIEKPTRINSMSC